MVRREILWTYYELFVGIDAFPSLADTFWIAGYALFAFHLIATYRFFVYHEKEARRIWQEENR